MDHGNHKKVLLQQLIASAMGGPNKSLQEIISNIKSALDAYKNFAREWDNIEGGVEGANGKPSDEEGGLGKEEALKQIVQGQLPPGSQLSAGLPNLQPIRSAPGIRPPVSISTSAPIRPLPLGPQSASAGGVPPPPPVKDIRPDLGPKLI